METPEDCNVFLCPGRYAEISLMSHEITNCPKRGRGRTFDRVFKNTGRGKIFEYALQDQGATLNPAKFNVKDPNTYAWDVLFKGQKTEIKSFNFIGTDKRWWSWHDKYAPNAFLNNLDIIDTLLIGDYVQNTSCPHTYHVKWLLMTKIDTEWKPRYVRRSGHNPNKMYYHHKSDPNHVNLLRA